MMKVLVDKIYEESTIEGTDKGLHFNYNGKEFDVIFDNNDIRRYLKNANGIENIEEWNNEEVATEYGKKEEEIDKYFLLNQIEKIKSELEK